jgi:hypothetical protein
MPHHTLAHTYRPRLLGPLALLAVALGLLAMPSRAAHANGVPIRIPLSYLSGLSNWGPQEAHGEAEISYAEALIKVDAEGLTPLKNENYQLWLVKSGTNRAVPIATFNAPADGIVGYTGTMKGLDGYDYDLVIITVEPAADSDPSPSDKRSIGGFFAPLKKPDPAAPAGSSDTMPAVLPNTGDAVPPPPTPKQNPRHAIALALFAIGGASLYLTIRRPRRPA